MNYKITGRPQFFVPDIFYFDIKEKRRSKMKYLFDKLKDFIRTLYGDDFYKQIKVKSVQEEKDSLVELRKLHSGYTGFVLEEFKKVFLVK
ncbi:MAG: hypothetical protein HQK51_05535 [Oligoflexia bacterium]|nr:hypothetical protein [Oligoflexia bacterium]